MAMRSSGPKTLEEVDPVGAGNGWPTQRSLTPLRLMDLSIQTPEGVPGSDDNADCERSKAFSTQIWQVEKNEKRMFSKAKSHLSPRRGIKQHEGACPVSDRLKSLPHVA